MRVLVTGVGGFVGRHLAVELESAGHEVHGLDLVEPAQPVAGAAGVRTGDVTDATVMADLMDDLRPDAVVHLAGAASVGESFERPLWTWHVNLGGTTSMLEAVRTRRPSARVLVVTSAEAYGLVPARQLPVGPGTPFRPHSPYGASKAAADIAAGQYRDGYGLDVLRARPFNHLGPGQDARFVVPSIARQIAAGERDGDDPVRVRIGNVSTRRDFLDVRDVVRAYRLILELGDPATPYVVARGFSVTVGDLLDGLVAASPARVEIVADPARRREGEQDDLYGSSDRLAADTGWKPTFDLETTLRDTLEWWRARVREEA